MTQKASKYSNFFDARRGGADQPANRRAETVPVMPEQPKAAATGERAQPVTVGKRNNPAYVQRTAYIRKTTDHAVKMKLLQQGGEKEFSELVEELLAGWLQESS